MAKRVQVGVEVEVLELEMPDGRVYKWAIDMWTMQLICKEHGGTAFEYIRGLVESYADDPMGSYLELMYIGLMGHHPELTREDIGHMFPPNQQVMESVVEGLISILPDATPVNPTMPALNQVM